MQTAFPEKTTDHDLKLVALILLAAMVFFHLGLAYSGRGIQRDQHLGTAVEYAKGKIDLLRPIIIGANANGVSTPLEFPIWQAFTAALMKLGSQWLGWGNVVSLIAHISSFWPIFQLSRRMFSTRVGWWAVVFFAAQPLTFVWGGMAGADNMAAAFSIWFVYLASEMMARQQWFWWLAATLVGCLSAMTKAPFFLTAGLTTFFWLLREYRGRGSAWLKLVSAGVISVVSFMAWNYHCNDLYKLAEIPYSDLQLGKGTSIMDWWFGDLSSRLNVTAWVRGAWRILTALLGSVALVFLPITGWTLRGSAGLRLWIASGLVTVLIFTSLVLVHWHYYYIVAAPVALLAARAAAELEPAWWRVLPAGMPVRAVVCLFVATVSLMQGLRAMHLNLFLDRYPDESAALIRNHTRSSDKLVVWGGGWGVPLFRAQREGLTIHDWEPIKNSAQLLRLKQLGFNKLVLLNPSPLLVAINTASGTRNFKTAHLPDELPMAASDWEITFASPSVLILDIPR